jgi:hypothetical protein
MLNKCLVDNNLKLVIKSLYLMNANMNIHQVS